MRVLKITGIVLLAYAGIVVGFESLIGYLQPSGGSTLVITTQDPDGTPHDRVLSRLESGGQLYVAANHWPRAWYKRALQNGQVQVTLDGAKASYRATEVSGDEYDRVNGEHALGPVVRFLTGFPPRKLMRLDPQ